MSDNARHMSKSPIKDCFHWYSARVMHQNEFRVSEFFQKELGLKSIVPRQRVLKRKNGIIHSFIRPLLSNYVFFLAKYNKIHWPLFYSPKGVMGVVCFKGRPATIPEEQVLSLDKVCKSDEPAYEIDYKKLKRDERIEVVDGPLKGAIGNYIKTSDKKGKFLVSIDLFKRTMITELEVGFFQPI